MLRRKSFESMVAQCAVLAAMLALCALGTRTAAAETVEVTFANWAAAEGTTRDDDELFARLEAELAVDPPADPAVARLLPDASRDDMRLRWHVRRRRRLPPLGCRHPVRPRAL